MSSLLYKLDCIESDEQILELKEVISDQRSSFGFFIGVLIVKHLSLLM